MRTICICSGLAKNWATSQAFLEPLEDWSFPLLEKVIIVSHGSQGLNRATLKPSNSGKFPKALNSATIKKLKKVFGVRLKIEFGVAEVGESEVSSLISVTTECWLTCYLRSAVMAVVRFRTDTVTKTLQKMV